MDPNVELAIEGLTLQLETMAAGLLVTAAIQRKMLEDAGIDPKTFKLSEEDEAERVRLMQSIAQRLVNVAMLAADASGQEVDRQQVTKNVIGQLQEAIATKGANMRDFVSFGDAVYAGASVADAEAQAEYSKGAVTPDELLAEPKASDEEKRAFFERLNAKLVEGASVFDPDNFVEDDENLEPATDDDLLAVFRSTRTKKAEDPYVEFEDGKVRANFYQPETLPEDPEEFMDYDNKAVQYFKGLTAKIKRANLIDDETLKQVTIVLDGGTDYVKEKMMTADGKITQTIIEQGHDSPYFEVELKSSVEAAEAMIAAYSVSIARLRGAYMQAKLQELQEYAEQNS